MFEKQRATLGLLVILALVVAGCGTADREEDVAQSEDLMNPSPEVLAALASADQKDGAEDSVVSACFGCQLQMDGKEAHAVQIGSYQAYACSEVCQNKLLEQPSEIILTSMEVSSESSSP